MSYTSQNKIYKDIMAVEPLRGFEKDYLKPKPEFKLNEDEVVEMFLDDLRKLRCLFRFKPALGSEFESARDSALNCLENRGFMARKVQHWIIDALNCTDCILLVYIRDVLKKSVPKRYGIVKERQLYEAYRETGEEDLKYIETLHTSVYQMRSDYLHRHRVLDVSGRREIRPIPKSIMQVGYDHCRRSLKKSMDIIVPRYRSAFPNYCVNENE